MYTSNQLMFPHAVIPQLRKLRGPEWEALIDQVMQVKEDHEESLAFALMMIRLNGCMGCETDSYRAMRGCDTCSVQTLRRFKGSDSELIENYRSALEDVRRYLIKSGKVAPSVARTA